MYQVRVRKNNYEHLHLPQKITFLGTFFIVPSGKLTSGKRVFRLRVREEEMLSGDLEGFSVRVVIPSNLVLTLHHL